jgi:hypothetical protein
MIWALIPNPIKRGLAWLLAGLAAVWAIRAGAKREARTEAALDALLADAKTAERIDHADTGIGATDQQRIDRLREFAAQR